jgi:uncharacterized protein YjeT (DUF2065 family)
VTTFPTRMLEVLDRLRAVAGHEFNEDHEFCRVDQTRCAEPELLNDIRALAEEALTDQLGRVQLFGEVSGEFPLNTAVIENVAGELVSFIFFKINAPQWWYFLTIDGLATALAQPELAADLIAARTARIVWIAQAFPEFASRSLQFRGWGGSRAPEPPKAATAQPPKLVRDLAPVTAPVDLSPWLLESAPTNDSMVFEVWRSAAFPHLIFSLPDEISRTNGAYFVALKGPRSVAASVENPLPTCDLESFHELTDTIRWIYLEPRESDTKFTLLNYQLALDWQDGRTWPTHLFAVLRRSYASAKDAFAFHLHDQSKEFLKTLGDLRKALQEDVVKIQQSTRDLLAAFWRDFAIAAIVLALRTPSVAMSAQVLRVVTLATALFIAISIIVTLGSNARFNRLAAAGREMWRTKLYPFVTPDDWTQLVENPIRASQNVYRVVMGVVMIVYLIIIVYLIFVASYVGEAIPVSSPDSGVE